MEKLTDVLTMGGYATYVWPSFIFAALLMLGMVITSMRSLRKAQRTLNQLQVSQFEEPEPVTTRDAA